MLARVVWLGLVAWTAAWGQGLWAVRDARVFDGSAFRVGWTVVVDGTRIAAAGPQVQAPEGARIVDGRGRTLLPGLIDVHVHAVSAEALRAALAFGVTTEFDMFSLPGMAAGGGADAADLRSSGILATAPGGHGTEYGVPIPTVRGPEDAEGFVAGRVKDGADFIKIVLDDGRLFGGSRPTLSAETVRALTAAAHARNRLAVAHIVTKNDVRVAVEAGVDVLEHLYAGTPDADVAGLLARRRIPVTPTLSVMRTGCGKPGAALTTDNRLAIYLSQDAVENLRFAPGPARSAEDCRAMLDSVRGLRAAGVTILAGTDVPNPGTAQGASLHGELELLVEAGLTPVEALRAATSAPAEVFGLKDRGRIAPGLRADLVLVEGDPSRDIRATRSIVMIWKAGAAVERRVH
jgi:imidazolonepropionase-like amidohydrolase